MTYCRPFSQKKDCRSLRPAFSQHCTLTGVQFVFWYVHPPTIQRQARCPGHSIHSPSANMTTPQSGFCTIDEALEELRAGRMIVLVDDENRENEGDLVMAGQLINPAAVNFMIRHACGRSC